MTPTTVDWRDEVDADELEAAVVQLRAAIDQRQAVVIAAHVTPDADSLGGVLALHLALSAVGVRSVPVVGEAIEHVPAALTGLPGADQLRGVDQLPDASAVDLLVSVDAASPERLGAVAGYLDVRVPSIMLDHHPSASGFGDASVIAPGAAATVQVVVELLDSLGLTITADIASCLYAGLMTDTGRFAHASTDAAVMTLAARLISAGADHVALNRQLYDTRSLGELQLLGRALERLTYVADVRLVHTHLTRDELDAVDAGLADTEGIVDLLRSADVARVAVALKPAADGTWRVSMRARGDADVGALAQAFGGGGHTAAAGFTSTRDVDAIVADIVAWLRAE